MDCFNLLTISFLFFVFLIWDGKAQPNPTHIPASAKTAALVVDQDCQYTIVPSKGSESRWRSQHRQPQEASALAWFAGREWSCRYMPAFLPQWHPWEWGFHLRVDCILNVQLTGINPEYPLEGLILKLKLQYFGHLMQRANSLEKTWCWGRLRARGDEATEDEMVGWHHWLSGHKFEQTPGDRKGQGSLACFSSWGHKD